MLEANGRGAGRRLPDGGRQEEVGSVEGDVDGSLMGSESRADSFHAEESDVGDETKKRRQDDSEILT